MHEVASWLWIDVRKVVRLGKSLYGLRQASRTFNKRLVQDLKTIVFEQCLTDPCVLRFMMGDEVIGMILIHVDDILHAGLKRPAEYLLQELGNLLPTKNLGEVNFFLSCAFRRDREAGTIEISQESYIRSVLERFNICRTSSIPASPANNYRSVKEDMEAGDMPFREVVELDVDRQPDEARHLKRCTGGGETLSRAEEEPLEGLPRRFSIICWKRHTLD